MEIIATNAAALLDFVVPSAAMANGKSIKAFDFLRFTSQDGELLVVGSNGQQTMMKRSLVTGEVYSVANGSICIEADKLIRVLRTMTPNKPVNISLMKDSDKALCKCGRSRIQLATIESSKYPSLDVIDQDSHAISLPINSLVKILKHTAYASAKDDVRYYLNAVLLECDNITLTATSSDGHCLSTRSVPVEVENLPETMRLLLPNPAVNTLLKLSGEGDVHVRYDANRVEFTCGEAVYRSQLVDGKYPDVKRLVPTIDECKNTFSAEKGEILDVVKRLASALTGEKCSKITLRADDKEQIHCSAVTLQEAKSEDWISGRFSGADDFKVNFNPDLVLDAVSHIEDDFVSMHFNEKGMLLLKPVAPALSLDYALVMPTR